MKYLFASTAGRILAMILVCCSSFALVVCAMALFSSAPVFIENNPATIAQQDFLPVMGQVETSGKAYSFRFSTLQPTVIFKSRHLPENLDHLAQATLLLASLPKGVNAGLYWRLESSNRLVTVPFLPRSGGILQANVRSNSDWGRPIGEFGVAFWGDPGSIAEFGGIQVAYNSLDRYWQVAKSALATPRIWSHQSINSLEQPVMVGSLPWLPFLILAMLPATLLFLLLPYFRRQRRTNQYLLGLMLFVWLINDALWSATLNANANVARQTFANLDIDASLASIHGSGYYELSQTVKLANSTATAQRVFVFDSSQLPLLTMQYLLLPHNVYTAQSLLEPGSMHAGDIAIVLDPQGNFPSNLWHLLDTESGVPHLQPIEQFRNSSGTIFKLQARAQP